MNELWKKLLGNKWLAALTAVGVLLLVFGASGGIGPAQGSSSGGLGGGGGSAGSGSTAAAATGGTGSMGTVAASSGSGSAGTLQTALAYEESYDRQLTTMINQIAGVSDALVMVTVNTTPVEQYGQNVTISRQSTVQSGGGGGSSTTTTQSTQSQVVTVQGPNGNQTPILVQEQMPHIAGVLVEAKSADVVRMQAEVTTAVEDALGIPVYKITVLARK